MQIVGVLFSFVTLPVFALVFYACLYILVKNVDEYYDQISPVKTL